MHGRGFAFLLLTGAALAGCQKERPPLPPTKPPTVVVVHAILQKDLLDYEDFSGRTEAVETVEVRARVSGYLEKVCFKEGTIVKKGDLLFEIDPRPLQAEVDRAEANLAQAEARQRRLTADVQRAQEMVRNRAIGREEFDKISGDHAEAVSGVRSARAALNIANLNLSYSRVTSATKGRISRRMVDPGNMVKADDTILTRIVTIDPMYASFDIDERTYLRIQRFLEKKGVGSSEQQEVPVEMGLADEDGFSQKGKINFVDNRVDPDSVSVWVRGVFPNPSGLLTPGLFVRVRLPVGDPYEAVVIPERALVTDQGQKFVYVVSSEDKAVYRRVELGEKHNQMRVVKKGVEPGERVIVSGLQRVRYGSEVDPQEEGKKPPDLDEAGAAGK
jgi:RND family efflux transporter MFP subunit